MESNLIGEVKELAALAIRPYAVQFEHAGRIPESLIQQLAAMGLLGATFPQEYGGLGLDQLTYGRITEEIGKACASTRSLLTVHNSLVGESILRFGSAAQKNKWIPLMAAGKVIAAFALTEENAGSDAAGVQANYQKTEGGYKLNGKKKWITFGERADLYLVIATGDAGITAFLVSRKTRGVHVQPIKGMMAGKAACMADLYFDDVLVEESTLLGLPGNGFSYVVNTALDHGRYSVAWGGLAIAQEALETMVAYARKRKQFGKKLHEFQLVQGMIGDAVTGIHAARALCVHAAGYRENNHPDAALETSIAKYFTSKLAVKVTGDAVQLHGANGCNEAYSAERLFREAKVLEIIEGSSQVQQLMIGSYGLQKYFPYVAKTITV